AGWPTSFGGGGADDRRAVHLSVYHRVPHVQRTWATRQRTWATRPVTRPVNDRLESLSHIEHPLYLGTELS
ncbi:MAG: hypothetical protein V3W34_09210, partial [Phycisphaerae bacterium]